VALRNKGVYLHLFEKEDIFENELTLLLFAMYYYQGAIAVRLLRRYVELSHFDRATLNRPIAG